MSHEETADNVAVAEPPATSAPSPVKAEPQRDEETRRQPPYHVILLDDDDHSYEYVIRMLMQLFGHALQQAYEMACEVDNTGRVIVDTTTLERAELKRDQIHAFGKDRLIMRCQGAMSAVIEPAV